jgi:hypothetical protein
MGQTSNFSSITLKTIFLPSMPRTKRSRTFLTGKSVFLALKVVTAGAAEFGSATIRYSPFDGIFVETNGADQREH